MTEPLYELRFEPRALKQLKKLDPQNRERLFSAAKLLAINPRPGRSKKLVGEYELWRVRIGDYRLVYTVWDETLVVLVVGVGHRREVYRF